MDAAGDPKAVFAQPQEKVLAILNTDSRKEYLSHFNADLVASLARKEDVNPLAAQTGWAGREPSPISPQVAASGTNGNGKYAVQQK